MKLLSAAVNLAQAHGSSTNLILKSGFPEKMGSCGCMAFVSKPIIPETSVITDCLSRSRLWKDDIVVCTIHSLVSSPLLTDCSSTIIEHLLGSFCTDTGLIYFYCDHQDSKTRTFRNFVGAGISQLLGQAPQCINDVIELYTRKKGEVGGKPNTGECLQLLKAFTLRFTSVSIIVDALDECIEAEAFVAGLNELRSFTTTKTTARVLFTSRQEVQIQRQISHYLTHSLCLTADIEQDIRRFVTDQVYARVSTGTLKFRDPDLQNQIIATLCNGADGM